MGGGGKGCGRESHFAFKIIIFCSLVVVFPVRSTGDYVRPRNEFQIIFRPRERVRENQTRLSICYLALLIAVAVSDPHFRIILWMRSKIIRSCAYLTGVLLAERDWWRASVWWRNLCPAPTNPPPCCSFRLLLLLLSTPLLRRRTGELDGDAPCDNEEDEDIEGFGVLSTRLSVPPGVWIRSWGNFHWERNDEDVGAGLGAGGGLDDLVETPNFSSENANSETATESNGTDGMRILLQHLTHTVRVHNLQWCQDQLKKLKRVFRQAKQTCQCGNKQIVK